LVNEINTYFGEERGGEVRLSAKVDTAETGLVITAEELPWDIESFKYRVVNFNVFPNFTATVVSNLHATADVTINAVPTPPATKGIGTYKQVAEMEWASQGYFGYNRDMLAHNRARTVTPLSAQEFKTDGITPNEYHILTINWEYTANHTLTGTDQRGSIILALPAEDAADSQVNKATVGIVPVLDKYIVTEYGVSVAQAAKLA